MTLSDQMLHWYDQHRRHLPWRVARPDPYGVWLSEVMLQQTTVAAVIPYFQTFTQRWPTVTDLAQADSADVMAAWAGLGYYARARNLLACAQTVAAQGGVFPDSEAGLLALPGIGPYTAAAIAAIAFDRPAVVMDGNVERVMARLFAITLPLPEAKPHLKQLAAALTPQTRPGDYAQAVMDLGATICTPRSPRCGECPWARDCIARRHHDPLMFPVKAAKAAKPLRRGLAFWVQDAQGQVLLCRRPPKGLLGGMMGFPGTPWREGPAWTIDAAAAHAPLTAPWQPVAGYVHHTFTHFHLELAVVKGLAAHDPALGQWCARQDVLTQGLPTVMKKIARLVLAERSPADD